MKLKGLSFLVIALFMSSSFVLKAGPTVVGPGDLIGSVDTYLVKIDPATGTAIFLMNLPTTTTEIEFRDDGVLFVEAADGNTGMYTVDVTTLTANLLGNHPCCALNGMEFINGVLYGTNIEGPVSPSTFVMVDQNTLAFTSVGLTGFNQITGLALDPQSGILYGSAIMDSNGGDFPINSMLVTIDVNTGLATPVGMIGEVVGGLEFGPNGILYGGTVQWAQNPGSLLTIDKNTGLGTVIGPTGFPKISGLAFYPGQEVPINFTVILIIFAVLAVARFAWKYARG